MMHFTSIERHPFPDGKRREDLDRRNELVAEVDRLKFRLDEAKRAAAESLRRANEAPGPLDTTSGAFAVLYEAHLQDREVLFALMRRFDEARDALRAFVLEADSPKSRQVSADRNRFA
ncbi:hypothetical protein [Chelativorans sp. AA-79]|uniref:hypothetical protein n=1 Tax=Chelativorans sp. AA-79 TaxID=3028735 RepID=UPI0023F67EE3|nr:hypothetical protein [Chelativorans sp. AA-79]WEX08228.1 hypothetical protein PVE73_19410 [Chelativorans sp. AA-79]